MGGVRPALKCPLKWLSAALGGSLVGAPGALCMSVHKMCYRRSTGRTARCAVCARCLSCGVLLLLDYGCVVS